MRQRQETAIRTLVFLNRYYDPDQSATSQILTDLARGLAARGLSVHIVCSRQLYTDAQARLAPSETLAGVHVHRLPTTRFGRDRLIGRSLDYASFYLSAGAALLRLIGPGVIVIAKTDPPLISLVGALVAHLRGATLVNWQQDVFPEVATALGANPLPRVFDAVLRRLRNASLRAAAMNVVIGERMQAHFLQCGIPGPQLRVIENWADARAIRPKPPASSALRARLGIVERFVVGYSGNLGRAHEFETLLAAAETLRPDPRIVFLMVGAGAGMEALRRAVAERDLDSFLFLPYQPRAELADSLAAADVHLASLLPSLEGLIVPSKLYGILAAGRPIIFIGDPDGDSARVIGEARCGATVAINDGAALAALIRNLQSDPAECAAMGRRSRETFEARHTLDHAVERWLQALELKPEPHAAVVRPPAPSS